MFAPNSIQSRLLSREEEEQSNLLNEVNSTLESLQKWKENEKKLDEDLEEQLAIKRANQKVDVDEETQVEIEIAEPNIENLKCQQIDLIYVKELKHQNIINVPELKTIENYNLFKTGDDLSKVLSEWNSEFDKLNINVKNDKKQGSEWEQVDEIEKELAELEQMIEGVELDSD